MDSTYLKEYIAILDQLSEAGPNVSYQSPSMGGASSTQYDDGSSASNYDAGPLAVQQKKNATGAVQSNRVRYNTGTDSVQVKDYASGVKKLTVHGPGEDAYVGPNASAQRLGVDPAKVNNFVNPQSNTAPDQPQTMEEGDYELEEMRRLTYGKEELDEAPPIPAAGTTPPKPGAPVPAGTTPAPTTAQANTFNAVNAAAGPAVNQITQAGEKWQAGNKFGAAVDTAKAVNNVANAAGMTFGDKAAALGSAAKGGYHALKAHVTGNDAGAAFAGSMASDLTQPYADYTNSENFASDFNAGMSNGGGKSANPKLQKAYDNNLVNANSVRNAANSMNKTANQLKSGDASAMQNFEPPSLYRDDQTPYLDINKRNAITQQPVQTKAEIQTANPVQEGDYELEEMRRLAYGTSDDIEEAGVGEGQTSDMRKFFSAEPGTASIPQVAARYRAYEEDMSEDAGNDAAYNKYAGARATGDMLNKEMQPEKGVTSFTSPQAKAIATDLSTGLAGANPEMEKRYTMNKLNTATPATDVSGELEEDDLDAMRRIMNHRR